MKPKNHNVAVTMSYLVLIFFMTLCLSGCKPDEIVPLPSPVALDNPTSTPTPNQMVDKTSTPVPMTPSPQPTVTVSKPPAQPTMNCSAIEPGSPPVGIISGSIVILNHDKKALEFVDIQTGKRTSITTASEEVDSYAVSPDGKWLAYQSRDASSQKTVLKMITLNRKNVIKLQWKSEWRNIGYWLDKQRLVIKLASAEDGEFDSLILNPVTGGQVKLVANFPGIYPMESPPDWRRAGPAIYAPSLKEVVFAGVNSTYFLWDVDQNGALAALDSISFINIPFKAPVWSPDGKQVLVAAPNAPFDIWGPIKDVLYSLDLNGNVVKLTDLHTKLSSVSINRYNWSNDGRYIALFFYSKEGQYANEQLAVLNVSTRDLTSYCIQGEENNDYRQNMQGYYDDQVYTGAIWSPNGHQFIVENHTPDNMSNIYLVDIDDSRIYQLIGNENIQPVGWMVTQP